MSVNRRTFLRQTAAGSAGLVGLSAFPLNALAADEVVRLTILHTNDVHSHIEPFPDNDPKYPGLGGVARRASLIQSIRQVESNVLLLDAGDIYQGTPYFNRFGGELELKLMTAMGYDAAAIGNHDFDNGLQGITKQMAHAGFPLLCANYDFSETEMAGRTFEYKIFERSGIKIGVFGLGIELEGLVDRRLYGKTRYLDPMEQAARMALLLKKDKGCHLVVCLSHLGYKYEDRKVSDVLLAKQSREIDIIIGGHTHTFLDKPVVYQNRDGKDVHVCQVGWAGIKLGRLDVVFEKGGKRKEIKGTALFLQEMSIRG
jgi:5'-nucleotidase